MTSPRTYKIRAIVLRKTKIGEKDLVVTMLSDSGALVRGVAKGARKPGGSFASKLDLFSEVDAMLAKGRSIDVITDARFSKDAPLKRFAIEQSACASVVAELLCAVGQEGLDQPRLFDMSKAAMGAIAAESAENALAICAADLFKTLALAGFKPSFDTCMSCGSVLTRDVTGENVPVSIIDGGAFCSSCPRPADTVLVPYDTVGWSRAFLGMRFDDILAAEVDVGTSLSVLQFARQWCRTYVGKDLKSMDFLFTSGLF